MHNQGSVGLSTVWWVSRQSDQELALIPRRAGLHRAGKTAERL